MVEAFKQLWHRVRRDPVLLVLLIFAAAYFIFYYVTDPVRPGGMFGGLIGHSVTSEYLGWFGYYDQGQYLKLAHTLAGLNLNELHITYSYGIGYPLVAVPAIWLGINTDPFVFFNLIAFVFAAYATYITASKLLSPLAGFLAGFGLIFATPLIHYVDQPWNSTVCLLVMSVILVTLTVKNVSRWHLVLLGLLLGWAFAARYIDVLWLGVLALASLYRGSFKILAKQSLLLFVGALIFILPVLYSHDKIFGSPFRTPYVNHIGLGGVGGSDQGLQAYNLKRAPRAALALFASPRLAGSTDSDRGLLVSFFWALAAIPGAIILLKNKNTRLFFVCFIAMVLIASLFYLSFRASTPGSLKYGELHYFKMFWPGLVILAVAFFDKLIKQSRTSRSTK